MDKKEEEDRQATSLILTYNLYNNNSSKKKRIKKNKTNDIEQRQYKYYLYLDSELWAATAGCRHGRRSQIQVGIKSQIKKPKQNY